MLLLNELDDPLLRFTEQLEDSRLDGFSETANVEPLFTSQAAATDMQSQRPCIDTTLRRQLAVVDIWARAAAESGWRPLQPTPEFRSGTSVQSANRLLPGQRRPWPS
jgi:hypothetical protein